MLFNGLEYVGFTHKRISACQKATNDKRFVSMAVQKDSILSTADILEENKNSEDESELDCSDASSGDDGKSSNSGESN